jgi:hypothetical protein
MNTLTARESLRVATNANRFSNSRGLFQRAQVSSLILVVSAILAIVSSVLLFANVFDGEAAKAFWTIELLSLLSILASVYSLGGVAWQLYWTERSKRIEAETDLDEMSENMQQVVIRTMQRLPEQPRFGEFATKSGIDVAGASKLISCVAQDSLVSQELISDVEETILVDCERGSVVEV